MQSFLKWFDFILRGYKEIPEIFKYFQDVDRLYKIIKPFVKLYRVIPNWSHAEFIFGRTARSELYGDILEAFRKYDEDQEKRSDQLIDKSNHRK
jgi:hypothetical protein